MKKFYAALLAAAMLTAGASITGQAADYVTGNGFALANKEGESGQEGYNRFHVSSEGSIATAGSISAAGNFTAAGGNFKVSSDGSTVLKYLTAAGINVAENFAVYNTGDMKAASGNFSGALTAANGKFSVDKETGTIKTTGGINAAGGKFTVDEATGTVNGTDGHFSGDVYVANRTEGVGASLAAHDTMIAENKANILNNSNRISALSNKVSDLGGEIDSVGAISSALAGLHPLDYDGTGSKFQLAAAMGNYDGTQAAAIGGFYHFNEDVMMSLGGATSFGGDNKSAFNVGVTFRVGEGGGHKAVPADVQERLDAQEGEIAALKAQVEALLAKDAQ